MTRQAAASKPGKAGTFGVEKWPVELPEGKESGEVNENEGAGAGGWRKTRETGRWG